ncbi:unannotated protein [freshwater metagenome]|uniref:Unannotated protein n=1 Tax=freshwater metagenome TaxID=449393 RepID=A0A6J7C0H8_9ZZZZ
MTRSGCRRSLAMSLTDKDEVLVASTQVSDTTASAAANTAFLTSRSSNTASMTKSASASTLCSCEALTSVRMSVASPWPMRPLATRVEICSRTLRKPASARSAERSVMTTGTLRVRAKSTHNWLAMRPAPMMPTLVIGRASAGSGAPEGRLARLVSSSKEYTEARKSWPNANAARASFSAVKPSSRVRVWAAAMRSHAT